MASFSTLAFVMTLLSIAVFTMPSAEAILGLPLNAVAIVTGTVNCPGTAAVIQNAPVSVVCGNGTTTKVLASGLTDVTGLYYFVLSTTDTITFDKATCQLSVNVPPTACTVNIPNGILNIPFTVFNVLSNAVGVVVLVVSNLIR